MTNLGKICIAFFMVIPALLWANGSVSFVSGDVKVIHNGATSALKKGDTVPKGAIIQSGVDGRASIFDTTSKSVTVIRPNSKLTYHGGTVKGGLFKKQAFSPEKITTVAGVRGRRLILPCSTKHSFVKKFRASQPDLWKNYQSGDFKAILAKTARSKDTESRFLRALSNYQVYGLARDSKIAYDLKEVSDAKDAEAGMKYDAQKALALLYFDKGEYEEALKIYSKLLDGKDPRKIDEFSYYFMILLNRNMGRQKEEADVWKHADQHCKSSKLIKSLK